MRWMEIFCSLPRSPETRPWQTANGSGGAAVASGLRAGVPMSHCGKPSDLPHGPGGYDLPPEFAVYTCTAPCSQFASLCNARTAPAGSAEANSGGNGCRRVIARPRLY